MLSRKYISDPCPHKFICNQLRITHLTLTAEQLNHQLSNCVPPIIPSLPPTHHPQLLPFLPHTIHSCLPLLSLQLSLLSICYINSCLLAHLSVTPTAMHNFSLLQSLSSPCFSPSLHLVYTKIQYAVDAGGLF